jgi:hypothetical protein
MHTDLISVNQVSFLFITPIVFCLTLTFTGTSKRTELSLPKLPKGPAGIWTWGSSSSGNLLTLFSINKPINSISGHLGHGNSGPLYMPKFVHSLMNEPIHYIACGHHHTMALSGMFLISLLFELELILVQRKWKGIFLGKRET